MALNSNDNNYLDFDYDNEKEQRAIYSLDNVDFNLTTRITRLESVSYTHLTLPTILLV